MPRPRALIKVGYACNNHCSFCHTLDGRKRTASNDEIVAKIDRAAALGFAMVAFSGGEPTLRRELVAWCELAQRRGLATGVVSNGRMLAYPQLVDALMAHGLSYAHLSLHAGVADVHDRMTNATSWAQTLAAVHNLANRELELTVACVVTRENLADLRGLVDVVAPCANACLKLSCVEPKGGAIAQLSAIVPTVTEAAAAVRAALGYAQLRHPEVRLSFENLPLCLMEGWQHLSTDLRDHGFTHMVEAWEDDFCPIDERNRVHPAQCGDCTLRGRCPGLFAAYAARYGTAELGTPRAGPRSNSLTYAHERALVWPSGTACPVLALDPAPLDRRRTLFVRQRDTLVQCTTTSRDFADSDLQAIKWEREQLYLDVSDKPAPDDFAADLRKLARAAACAPCPAARDCPGTFEPARGDVFAADEARLREWLRRLHGDVLDIGCGGGRYADGLTDLARRGVVRYVGVDPDGAALALFAERAPWAELHQEDAERFVAAPAQWDAVLLINSINHLARPEALLTRLVASLRSGGTLLVADDVPFGLVRTRDQTERAETGPARFEHLRNHTAADAVRLLERLPLTITVISDVSRETSNQWLLRCVKDES